MALTPALQQSSFQAHLVEFPVELSRLVGLSLGGLLAEQEHQAAVVHVQGRVVPVHVCGQGESTALLSANLTNKTHLSCKCTLKDQRN